MTISACIALAELWANAAGVSLVFDTDETNSALLASTDPAARAHWRCALDLVHLCEQRTGKTLAELVPALDPGFASSSPPPAAPEGD